MRRPGFPIPISTLRRSPFVLIAMCMSLAVLASIAGCSSDDSSAPDSISRPTVGSSIANITDAGTGKGESLGSIDNRGVSSQSGGYGTRANPVPRDLVESKWNPSHEAKRFDPLKSVNLCQSIDSSITGMQYERFGFSGIAYTVAFEDGVALLACSTPNETPIWGGSVGPGIEGLSVPCPEDHPRAVADMSGAYLEHASDGTQGSGVYWVEGGTGTNNDGLWNWKFISVTTRDVVPTIWLLCS